VTDREIKELRRSRSGTIDNFLVRSRSNRFITPSVSDSDLSAMGPAGLLPLPLRIRFARDCCAGIAYLHACGFMHCDVKSLNFLVTSELVVKLSDLGEARKSHPDSALGYQTTLPRY
jgi:serine/threonine protein kinase